MKYLIYALLFGLALSACKLEEEFLTGGEFDLEFSLDTLRFDTVFTELGSATQFFKVYNRGKTPVLIDAVQLVDGTGSKFRMNVNGIAGDRVEQVEIWANDSVYVFLEVTIDPDAPLSVSPFVVEGEVRFETGDKQRSVKLEAWGQNANYFPSRFNRGVPTLLSCNNQTIVWDDPKPYVIYGQILIDSCLLEVAAGTQIYVHGGVAQNELFGVFNDGIIFTLQNGRIAFKGTEEAPITVQGDRLEEAFQEESGQWQGIIIGKGSRGNSMEYTTVKNAIFGVYVDSLGQFTARNSRFHNTVSSGLIGFRSSIKLENCLVYNNGSNSVQLVQGGDYEFDYCTVASYGVNASAIGMSNFFCYDSPLICADLRVHRLNARFRNCIFFGSSRDELQLSDVSRGEDPGLFSVRMEHCIVKLDQLLDSELYSDFLDSDACVNCINGNRSDALFADPNERDFRLDTLSIAEGLAMPLPSITSDIEGKPRDLMMPDIGCFERE